MGRPRGSRNKTLAQKLAPKIHRVSGLLPAVVAHAQYIDQIKPGMRDLADRFARIQEAIDELVDLKAIKAERAAHPSMRDVPGGRTGLVTFTYVGKGEERHKVSRFDAALDSAIEAKWVYISKELGQFGPDVEVMVRNGNVGQKAAIDYSALEVDELEFLHRIAVKLEAARGKQVVEARSVQAEPERSIVEQTEVEDDWGEDVDNKDSGTP